MMQEEEDQTTSTTTTTTTIFPISVNNNNTSDDDQPTLISTTTTTIKSSPSFSDPSKAGIIPSPSLYHVPSSPSPTNNTTTPTESNNKNNNSLHIYSEDSIDQPIEKVTESMIHEGEEKALTLFQRCKQALIWFSTSQLLCHSLLLLAQVFFGGFGVIGPMSIKHFPSSALFACLRTVIMSLTIFPLAVIFDWRHSFRHENYSERNSIKQHLLAKIPNGKDALLLVVLGTNLICNLLTYIMAVGLTNYTIVAIIQPVSTVFTCLLSILLKREGKSIVKILGVILAVVGSVAMLLIITFFGDGSPSSSSNVGSGSGATGTTASSFNYRSLAGAGIYLFNTFITATFLITQRVALDRKIPPLTVTSYSMIIAQIWGMIIAAFLVKNFNPVAIPRIGWIGLVYSGIVIGSMSFGMSSYAAKFTSPTVVSVYNTTAPIISTIFQYVFLRQTTTMYAVVGAMLITVGVVMVGYAKRKEEIKQQQELKDSQSTGDENQDEVELEEERTIAKDETVVEQA